MTLYLDTSSLIKLYVDEDGSDVVRKLVARAAFVSTSVIAYAEARATLARLRREGRLTRSKLSLAKRRFEDEWPTYLRLRVSDSLCREAGDLAERHRLRGDDSVHLASFAEIARRAGAKTTRFSSFDGRLNHAARALRRALVSARTDAR